MTIFNVGPDYKTITEISDYLIRLSHDYRDKATSMIADVENVHRAETDKLVEIVETIQISDALKKASGLLSPFILPF